MIRLNGVRKSFGVRRVLDGVTLALAPRRITALVGPNGSGKTTLIKVLLGLTRADAGRLELGGEPFDDAGSYRHRIGYAPQAPRLPEHLTVGEVFAMLRELRPREPVDEQLVDDFGLRAEWGSPVGVLSAGWRQKLAIASAFLFRPDVLLLDEPTAGLDPVTAGHFKAKLRRVRAQGRAILISSHILGEIEELADDLAFLDEGRLRFSGPVRSLLTETGARRLESALASLLLGFRAEGGHQRLEVSA